MKKLTTVIFSLALVASFMATSCIYDEPEAEIRPGTGAFVIVTDSAAGSVKGSVSEDGTSVTADLSQSSDSGLVLYLSDDKAVYGENTVVEYSFNYEVTSWGASSPNPKFLVRYGDSKSSWKNYDPSYSDKTNYEDAAAKSGSISNKITLKSKADAIVFATNGYQWAGESNDAVKITVTKVTVKE